MNSTVIAIIVSGLFIITLISGFFIGFWRGLKKSSLSLAVSIIGAIVAFFITPLITKAIMEIYVDYNGQTVKIGQLISVIAKNDPDFEILIENNPKLDIFLLNLPQAIANTLVFIILTFVVEAICYVIYKLFAWLFLKSKDKEKEKKHRILGGVVGLVKTFIITILSFMPFAALIGLANSFTYSDNYFVVQEQSVDLEEDNNDEVLLKYGVLGEYTSEQTVQVVRGLEDNLLTKVCGVFGLDNAMFDYLAAFKIEDEDINIRVELENYYKIADFGVQVSKQQDFKFIDINYDKLEGVVNNSTNKELFKTVVCDFVADLVINYDSYSFLKEQSIIVENSEVFDVIGEKLKVVKENGNIEKYFINDIDKLFDIFKVLGQRGILDEIKGSSDKSVQQILNILTNDENYDSFALSLKDVFKVNLVRDGIVPILQKGVDALIENSDKISADVSNWNESQWEELSDSLVSLAKQFSDLNNQINVIDVLEDPTILLTDESNYDITKILVNMGDIIDQVRDIEILKTEKGSSVVDKLLEENKISLPQGVVYSAVGEPIEISNYKELFTFISSSLVKIKDSGLYSIISADKDANEIMQDVADLISLEGNNNLLGEILLPLQQVEPTKSAVFSLISNLNNNVVNFSNISSYEDWKNDLGYISSLLINLNKNKVEEKSYLDLIINNQVDIVLKNISIENIEMIIKPLLYAKSTSSLKNELINDIKEVLDQITSPALSKLDITTVVLEENNSEDQVSEICNVLSSFVQLNKTYNGETLKELDKTILANLLNQMQKNAYRTILFEKNDEGLFNGAFINLVNKFLSEYKDAIDFIKTQPEYQNYFDEENYPYIEFTKIVAMIEEYEEMNS